MKFNDAEFQAIDTVFNTLKKGGVREEYNLNPYTYDFVLILALVSSG